MKAAYSLIISFVILCGTSITLSRPVAQASAPAAGSIEDERGLVALDQALREVANPFTIVCVGARPGDEDDGALAYLRKKLGARTVMLFATRGEGEDSPSSGAIDEELGEIHTREAIEAARLLGSDVMFLNLRDPGYSKSAEEALSVWGHDDALSRFVRAYRFLRPDVIITRHSPNSGEGVAQAAARVALEAFTGAPDAKVATEAGSEAWEVQRFFRMAGDDGDVAIELNEFDGVRGRTYAEIGLGAHHRFASRGAASDRLTPQLERSYYKLVASSSNEKLKRGAGLLDGITVPEKVSLSIAPPRVGDQNLMDSVGAGERLVDALIEKLVEKRAEGGLADLRERYSGQFVRVVRFTASIERAIALALGLRIEVSLSDRIVTPGQKLVARVSLRNGGKRSFPVVFRAPEELTNADRAAAYKESEVVGLGTGGVVNREFEYEVPKNATATRTASRHDPGQEYYAIGSVLPGAQPGEPFGAQWIVSAEIGLGQASIQVSSLARYEIAQPVEISTISFAALKDWSTPRDLEFPVRIRNRTPSALAGALWVVPLALSQDEYEPIHLTFNGEDQEITVKVKLHLPILKPPLAPDVLIEFRREKPAPPDPLGSAKIEVKTLDFTAPEELRVGYIKAKRDWLSFALAQIGVSHKELMVEEISSITHGSDAGQTRLGCSDLAAFDAIIVDENAFFAHPGLILQNRCLLGYARQGGTLVVLAQRPDDWNLILSGVQFSPYPITLSRDRMTFEGARVRILDAEHPLMSRPNQITAKDFEGWFVERAANVPRQWSSEYVPLLETGDPGEEPSRGALLVSRYGDGAYILSSLSLRRQLIAGNAGAYRLFANLVSLSKTSKPTPRPQ